MEFETKHVIAQDVFTETADANIAFALNPENDIVDGLEGVQAIQNKLDEVEAGSLEIQPPLSEEAKRAYREEAAKILSVGKRTVEALESADSERAGRIGSFFKGVGLASKR
jgi:hypothetical protein